jgi:dynactin complex subunit
LVFDRHSKVLNQRLTNLNQEQDSNNRQAQTIRNSIHNRTMENSRKTAQLQKYKVVEERLAESRNKQVDLKEQLKVRQSLSVIPFRVDE